MTVAAPTTRDPDAGRRWLARLALAVGLGACVLLVAAAGTKTFAVLLLVIAGVVVMLVGGWWAIAHRGSVRVVGALLVVAAAVTVAVALVRHHLLWAVLVSAGLFVVAFVAGRSALTPREERPLPAPAPAGPAEHPFLIMNPRSGGGKAERFGLREKAEKLGVEVAVLDGPDHVDVAELARKAIDDGADLIGVAGGDGTQALVAGVAAERGIPMFVIPAGTRNHFALDLGIDRDDLAASLEALSDGVDIMVDLGEVEGHPFVNNVSFGAYASIVERPDYRADKLKVTMRLLPDLLSGSEGPHLTAWADGRQIDAPQALLVSNNSYGTGDIAGVGRRARIDAGVMGVVAIRVSNARDAARLATGVHSRDITRMTAGDVVVESDQAEIPAGLDGESVRFTAPVRCRVRPGALRVRVPRNRPGFATVRPRVRPAELLRLAGPGAHLAPAVS